MWDIRKPGTPDACMKERVSTPPLLDPEVVLYRSKRRLKIEKNRCIKVPGRVPGGSWEGPGRVPGGFGSPLGPAWDVFERKGFAPYRFLGGLGRQRGGQEGPKGRPGGSKRGPRGSQERFCGYRFRSVFIHRFLIVFGMVLGSFLGSKSEREER